MFKEGVNRIVFFSETHSSEKRFRVFALTTCEDDFFFCDDVPATLSLLVA
jgi:hypothetical protein